MQRLLALFLLIHFQSYAQFDCSNSYELEQLDVNTYKVEIQNFDEQYGVESSFQGWLNTGTGKPDGTLLVFDGNGNKRVAAQYKNGIRVGTHLTWYPSGEKECETTWETDLYFTGKCYYKSGALKHQSENGNRPNAIYIDYYPNGQIATVNDWSRMGDKSWYENGQIKSFRDIKTNSYTEWYPNDRIKVKGAIVSGWVRAGTWSYYDENGKLIRELTYNDHLKAGSVYDEAGWTEEKSLNTTP